MDISKGITVWYTSLRWPFELPFTKYVSKVHWFLYLYFAIFKRDAIQRNAIVQSFFVNGVIASRVLCKSMSTLFHCHSSVHKYGKQCISWSVDDLMNISVVKSIPVLALNR